MRPWHWNLRGQGNHSKWSSPTSYPTSWCWEAQLGTRDG